MELLPPVGWADIATKTDLEHLRLATQKDIDNLRTEMHEGFDTLRKELTLTFRHELQRALRRQSQWNVATIFAAQSILVAAIKLL